MNGNVCDGQISKWLQITAVHMMAVDVGKVQSPVLLTHTCVFCENHSRGSKKAASPALLPDTNVCFANDGKALLSSVVFFFSINVAPPLSVSSLHRFIWIQKYWCRSQYFDSMMRDGPSFFRDRILQKDVAHPLSVSDVKRHILFENHSCKVQSGDCKSWRSTHLLLASCASFSINVTETSSSSGMYSVRVFFAISMTVIVTW